MILNPVAVANDQNPDPTGSAGAPAEFVARWMQVGGSVSSLTTASDAHDKMSHKGASR
jgi:hypothetical protein